MKDATLVTIRGILDADSTVDSEQRQRILQACKTRLAARMGTAREAAEILGCHVRTLERYAEAGRLRRVHLSPRKIRYDLNEVTRFAREGISATGPAV